MLRSRCLPRFETTCSCGGAPARTRLASGPSHRPAAGSRAATASGTATASGAAARSQPREAQGRNDPPRGGRGSSAPAPLPAMGAAPYPPRSRRQPIWAAGAPRAGRGGGSYSEALPGTASCSAPQEDAPPLPVQAAKMVGLARRAAERARPGGSAEPAPPPSGRRAGFHPAQRAGRLAWASGCGGPSGDAAGARHSGPGGGPGARLPPGPGLAMATAGRRAPGVVALGGSPALWGAGVRLRPGPWRRGARRGAPASGCSVDGWRRAALCQLYLAEGFARSLSLGRI